MNTKDFTSDRSSSFHTPIRVASRAVCDKQTEFLGRDG